MKRKEQKNESLNVVEKAALKQELEEYINLQLIKQNKSLENLDEKLSRIEDLLSSGLQKTTTFKFKEDPIQNKIIECDTDEDEELSYFDRMINFSEEIKPDPTEIGEFTSEEAVDDNFEDLDIKKPNFAKEEISQKPEKSFVDDETTGDEDIFSEIKETDDKNNLDSLVVSEPEKGDLSVSDTEIPAEKQKFSLDDLVVINEEPDISKAAEETKEENKTVLDDIVISSPDNKQEKEEIIDNNIKENESALNEIPDVLPDISDVSEEKTEEKKILSMEDKYGDILGETQPVKKGFDLSAFARTETEMEEDETTPIPQQEEQPKKKKKILGIF